MRSMSDSACGAGTAAAIQAPAGPARRQRSGRARDRVARYLSRPPDRVYLRRHGVRRSARPVPCREDREDGADAGFDPVWEARTNVRRPGWTAELWIPFSQLRFNDAPSQAWGLNVGRFTPTLERARLLGADSANRHGVGVAIRRSRRHSTTCAPRGASSCCHTSPPRRDLTGLVDAQQSVHRSQHSWRPGRSGHQARHRIQPDPRRRA